MDHCALHSPCSVVNIAIGAYLLDPTRIFWVVVAWEAVFLVAVLVLLTMFSCLAARSPSKGEHNYIC